MSAGAWHEPAVWTTEEENQPSSFLHRSRRTLKGVLPRDSLLEMCVSFHGFCDCAVWPEWHSCKTLQHFKQGENQTHYLLILTSVVKNIPCVQEWSSACNWLEPKRSILRKPDCESVHLNPNRVGTPNSNFPRYPRDNAEHLPLQSAFILWRQNSFTLHEIIIRQDRWRRPKTMVRSAMGKVKIVFGSQARNDV